MRKGIRRRDLLLRGTSFSAALSGPVLSNSANAQMASAGLTADEAQKIAKGAYIFAFPLIQTRRLK